MLHWLLQSEKISSENYLVAEEFQLAGIYTADS